MLRTAQESQSPMTPHKITKETLSHQHWPEFKHRYTTMNAFAALVDYYNSRTDSTEQVELLFYSSTRSTITPATLTTTSTYCNCVEIVPRKTSQLRTSLATSRTCTTNFPRTPTIQKPTLHTQTTLLYCTQNPQKQILGGPYILYILST